MRRSLPRRSRPLAAAAFAVACVAFAPSARAIGQRVDVQVVDRDTGEHLVPVFHRGEWWIAGRPGARYAVSLANLAGARTMAVISVDGVNALSGETAGWGQNGYVLDAYESTQVNGWRKNLGQVAAFEFTALPDSYAARTGRPANVGVIGVAVFDERPQPVARPRVEPSMDTARENSAEPSSDGPRQKSAAPPSDLPAPAAPRDDASAANRSSAAGASDAAAAGALAARRADRLGTGHGEIERSVVRWTTFERAQPTPNEIVAIHYDRYENLVAMGIVPRRPTTTGADPFPRSGPFVPDPPRR